MTQLHTQFKQLWWYSVLSVNIYPNFISPIHAMPSHFPLTIKNTALKEEMFYIFDLYKDVVTDVEVMCIWPARFRVEPTKLVQLQQIIPCSFSRKFVLTKAYTNGLTAELSSSRMWITLYPSGLILRDVKLSKLCAIMSGAQRIPNMAVTVTAIKVTRFRTLRTPCV